MKQIITILGISLLVSAGVFAQTYPEAQKLMSQGPKNSFTIDLKVGDVKTITGLWEDYQKKSKARKPKYDKKSKEYFADNAEIKSISSNTIDIYSTIEPKDGKGAVLTIWFDLGGAFLSSTQHPNRMAGAYEWMAGFENMVTQEFAAQILAAEEDALKALEKDLKGLEKEKADQEDKIKDLEKEIEQIRGEVSETTKAMAEKQGQIDAQQKAVEAAKAKLKKGKQ